jgi:hypothetical protein
MFQVQPTPAQCNPVLPQTPHTSGMIVGLMDGSVRNVSSSISNTTWWWACTPRGGEVLPSDW